MLADLNEKYFPYCLKDKSQFCSTDLRSQLCAACAAHLFAFSSLRPLPMIFDGICIPQAGDELYLSGFRYPEGVLLKAVDRTSSRYDAQVLAGH